jgi:Ca-activated chloride channel family protein
VSALCAALLILQAVISVHTELVAVPVAVTDRRGHPVKGLRQEDFRVFEDGRPQPIVAFRHGEEPITLGLIVDRSQSMQSKAPALLALLSALLPPSRADGELFAVDVNDRVSLVLRDGKAFTDQPGELRDGVFAMPTEGRTALYDGVIQGLLHLQRGHADRRVLIVVSDGGDNASRHTAAEVLAMVRRSDVVIYGIGLLGVAGEEEDPRVLKRLCKESGGAAYFPQTLAETVAVGTEVVSRLREQYTLGFVPGGPTEGAAFRSLTVKVTAAGGGRFHVRTRAGYAIRP